MAEHKTDCLVCGCELVYHDQASEAECYYCKKTFYANVTCAQDHFVCDSCHSLSAFDLIKQFCISSCSADPVEIALTLMRNPVVKMHGPEHHFLVPAVLLSAYYNRNKDEVAKAASIAEAERRARQILGGFCGFHGNCGAAVGTGIFVSLITGATPLSTEAWRLSNLITAQSLLVIADQGGPRCCKRNTFLAISTAGRFLKENFGVDLDAKPVPCEFNPLNRECQRDDCPFYQGK